MKFQPRFLPGLERLPSDQKRLSGAMIAFRRMHVKRVTVATWLLEFDRHWQRKAITTKTGKTVITYQPSQKLKKLQWKIVRYINRVNGRGNQTILPVDGADSWEASDIVCTKFATAFAPGSSIIKNARAHLDMRSAVSFDLRRAFELIKRKHLRCFLKRLGFPNDVAWVFSKLLTYKGRLQRGASCTPRIFNLLLARLDKRIAETVKAETPHYVGRAWVDKTEKVLKQMGWFTGEQAGLNEIRNKKIAYTRYGDDICISSAEEEFSPQLIGAIRQVILAEGFQLQEAKTRVSKNGVLELPGVVIIGNVIRPRRAYLVGLAEAIAANTLTREQLHGHLAFICSFPRQGQKGAYTFIKRILGKEVKLPVLRRPAERLA